MFTIFLVLCFTATTLSVHPIDEIDGYGEIKSDTVLLYRSDDMCGTRSNFIHGFDPRCNGSIDEQGNTWYTGGGGQVEEFCGNMRCLKSLVHIRLRDIRKCNIQMETTPIPASSFIRHDHTLDHIVQIKICDTPYAAKNIPHALQITDAITRRLVEIQQQKYHRNEEL